MKELQIKRIQLGNVAAFLIMYDSSVVLIDTGLSGTAPTLKKKLESLGIEASAISLIVLTHTHFDHAGGAAELQAFTGARLAVHTNEAGNLISGKTPFPKGTRWKAKLIRAIGNTFARKLSRYPSLNPDIHIDDSLDLREYGIPGKVLHTPGHTSGSVSVFLDNGAIIAGDNVLGFPHKEHFPPFANDREGVVKSWELYIASGANEIYPAHGTKVPVSDLAQEIEHARKKYL